MACDSGRLFRADWANSVSAYEILEFLTRQMIEHVQKRQKDTKVVEEGREVFQLKVLNFSDKKCSSS